MNDRDRAMVVSRLRTSFETSSELWAPANSNRRRRFTAALAVLTSTSSSARRWAPRASRFFVFSVFFEATLVPFGLNLKGFGIEASDELIERFDLFDGCEETLGAQRIQIILNRF